jgi:hypothetical protein
MTVFTYSRNSETKKERLCTHYQKFRKSCRPAERILQYKGLITGATYLHTKKIIALSGYSKMLSPFIYLYTITTTAISFPAIRERLNASVSSVEGIATKMACTTI